MTMFTFIQTQPHLSQRDRSTLCAIAYFAKVKVIRNDMVEYGVCKFLLVLH